MPSSQRYAAFLEALTMERLLLIALGLGLIGLTGAIWCTLRWASTDFGTLALLGFAQRIADPLAHRHGCGESNWPFWPFSTAS